MSVQRHYFPGNNTPQGFFSYYNYILGQREAERIICIKGGPGTGKSTLMKKIGQRFAEAGEDVDFLHCSADENSLDGIILRNRNKALIDGTNPHITDPLTPGAVDRILNLGECWNEEGISADKDKIIALSEKKAGWYKAAYSCLKAAGSLFSGLEELYNHAAFSGEIYDMAEGIVSREFGTYPVSVQPGSEKKFFASAITAGGTVNHIETLLRHLKKIYIINVPEGYRNRIFMEKIREGAVYRGFDAELFYCPADPEKKIDHIIVPQLELGFVTANSYHDIEPWDIITDENEQLEITLVDINDYMNRNYIEENSALLTSLTEEYDILTGKAVSALEKAKETHQMIEALYIPHMDFDKLNILTEELYAELSE